MGRPPKISNELNDPVENLDKPAVDDMENMFDPESSLNHDLLGNDEIGAIANRQTSSPHPFDGYKLGRNIKVGEAFISSTFIVLLRPTAIPQDDISNKNQDIYVSDIPGGGGSPQKGKRKTVTFPTSHTRIVTNRQMNQNEQVVFDRDIELSDGSKYKCAIVKGHAARAQICFKFDNDRNKIFADNRYFLADKRQATALYKLFESYYHQRTKSERAAKDFDSAQSIEFNSLGN